MPQYFKIGKFVASHGLAGDLVLKHNLGKKTALKGLEVLYIEDQPDNLIPYFIEKSTSRSETETLIKIVNIDTKESARLLTPKEVWLEASDFNKHAQQSAPIALLGFMLFDNETPLGEVIEVIEQPHQILCTISYQEKEILIPIHEDNLIAIDKKKRMVVVNVPDGLLDIYQ